MNRLRITPMGVAAIGLSGVAILSVPAWANPGLQFIVGATLVEILFALSWNLMFGLAGVTSFGHAAFFAIGSYAVGLALKSAIQIPFVVLLILGAVLAALVSLLVGFLTLKRLSGISFAILTMALGEILRIVIGYTTILGGDDGLSGIPRPKLQLPLVTIDLEPSENYFWFLCLVAFVVTGLLFWLTVSRFGRVLRCIRQDPERTTFLGLDIGRYRLIAFTAASGIAGLAGGLQAGLAQIVTPDTANYLHSAQPMLNSLLGGARAFLGPVIGTSVFSLIGYATRAMTGVSEVVTGIALLFIVLSTPTGILGLVKTRKRRVLRAAIPVPSQPLSGPIKNR